MSICVQGLKKHYRVHLREPGPLGSLRSLFARRYRVVPAVDGIDFEIAPGEIVGFLGPNGAGKTTTIKVLAGLLFPTEGRVQVAGFVPFEHKAAFKRRFALVMGQKSQLIWDLPPQDTFLVNQAIYEIPDDRYRVKLAELVELLDIGQVMHKPARQLSLGERMKCELAASLLHEPDILFLDEPTIGLDVTMQEAIRGFIRAYNERRRATVLLTSHYMADVAALCRRVLIINGGKIAYDGDLATLSQALAPYKIVKLLFEHPVAEADLRTAAAASAHAGNGHGNGRVELLEFQPLSATLRVPRGDVPGVSARLLGDLPVGDLTVLDPPLEEVVGRAFSSPAPAPGGGRGS